MRKLYTLNNIYEKSQKYKVGDEINVYKYRTNSNGKIEIVRKNGILLERYPYHMVVGTGENFSVKESFTYQEVVLLKRVRHILGRPKAKKGE